MESAYSWIISFWGKTLFMLHALKTPPKHHLPMRLKIKLKRKGIKNWIKIILRAFSVFSKTFQACEGLKEIHRGKERGIEEELGVVTLLKSLEPNQKQKTHCYFIVTLYPLFHDGWSPLENTPSILWMVLFPRYFKAWKLSSQKVFSLFKSQKHQMISSNMEF